MKQDGMAVPCLLLSLRSRTKGCTKGGNFTLPTEQEETAELHAEGHGRMDGGQRIGPLMQSATRCDQLLG